MALKYEQLGRAWIVCNDNPAAADPDSEVMPRSDSVRVILLLLVAFTLAALRFQVRLPPCY
jgi:hypothetical protein